MAHVYNTNSQIKFITSMLKWVYMIIVMCTYMLNDICTCYILKTLTTLLVKIELVL